MKHYGFNSFRQLREKRKIEDRLYYATQSGLLGIVGVVIATTCNLSAVWILLVSLWTFAAAIALAYYIIKSRRF